MNQRAQTTAETPGRAEPGADASTTLLNRVGASAVVAEVLRDLRLDPGEVFAAAGLEADRFADAEALVPLPDLARLCSACVRASGRSEFGLLIADRARAERIGLLGELFQSADDLRSALHDLIRYFHLTTRGGVAMLNVDGAAAEVRLALAGPYGDAATVFEDAVVGVLFHAIRRFLGTGWRPIEVIVSHAPQSAAEAYPRFFGAPVRFNALFTAIVFPADDLGRRMIAREMERRSLEAAASAATTKLDIAFDEHVRWAIFAHLGEPRLGIAPIAAELGMSRRTINRRLAERGQTFAQLLRSVRFATARRLLAESDTPLTEIALALGYSELSIFSAAFRAWSGEAPREWRRRHGRS
jgi:AraC-like DNA-binding protein